MTRRFLLTFSAAAWLIGAYWLYAHFVSPVVEPKQLTTKTPNLLAQLPEQAGTRTDLHDEHHAAATQFLPGQDWAKDADSKLKFGDILVYTNEIGQVPGNSGANGGLPSNSAMQLKPFALVWQNPNAKPGEPPLRITADSALIEFESSGSGSAAASLLSGEKRGRPIGGTLEGAVRIEGPNGLLIVGRGFTFSEQSLKLWSDNDVLFHYGPHHGTGHGLQVDFLPAGEKQILPGQPRLGGLRSVAVLRQVVVNLMGEAAPEGQPQRTPLKAGDQLHVTSDGRMQFDMEANLITFDHNVRVRHPLPGKQQEGLNCDLLTLVLSDAKQKPAINADPSEPGKEIALASNEAPAPVEGMAGWLPESLTLEKLLADGTGKRRVELFSQPRELHCNTAQVEYDLVKRVLNLRDSAAVDVLQGPQQMHAPEIMLAFHENNRDIRLAVARGAGNATSRMNDGRTVSAKWQKQLVKSFDPQLQLDIVEVQGDASLALDQEYELKGDSLQIRITPLVMGANLGAPVAGNAPRKDATPPPQVERVLGVGQVVLKSPQATAHTKWLDVQFQTADLPPEVPGEGGGGGLFGLQSPTNPNAAPAAGRPAPRGAARKEVATIPLDVQADSIRALVSRDRQEPTRMALADLWANTAVVVTQPMKAGQPPVQALGNELHVKSTLPAQQQVWVTGSPAQIRSGVSRLEGNVIEFDRERNTLHVPGAGVLQYPVNTALDGQPLDRPQLLQVKWAERLHFNGQTADFYEKVEASLRQMVMRCNVMHVSLSSPLRFDDPQLQKIAANQMQLAKIVCENKVELTSHEYQGNTIISRSSGKLGQFEINNITGKTEAQGPGYLMEWRRGQPQGDSRPNAGKAGKSAARPEKARDWTYSRIDFQGRMKGNVRERFTTFEDFVEVVYGPVLHATDHIESDELPEGAASITCDALKVEQYAETEAAPAFVKLLAEGNTKLELEYDGHPVHAQADEVKFDESKDYYLLRSVGTQKVIINREPTTADPRGLIKCSRVDIRNPGDPNRREFKVQQATVLNGVQPGG
ncbi:MAG: hypothetical protein V4719_09305 [Planctomycetota bacterium]